MKSHQDCHQGTIGGGVVPDDRIDGRIQFWMSLPSRVMLTAAVKSFAEKIGTRGLPHHGRVQIDSNPETPRPHLGLRTRQSVDVGVAVRGEGRLSPVSKLVSEASVKHRRPTSPNNSRTTLTHSREHRFHQDDDRQNDVHHHHSHRRHHHRSTSPTRTLHNAKSTIHGRVDLSYASFSCSLVLV